MNILVVDDDAAVRESVTKVLKAEGFNALAAADGREALDRFAAQHIDLLLLDLGLPLESGWETFERITRENPLLPIIIITGQANQYPMAVAAGVGALMEKPLDADQLIRTIQELLAQPRVTHLRQLAGQGPEATHIPSHSALFLKRLREQYDHPYQVKSQKFQFLTTRRRLP